MKKLLTFVTAGLLLAAVIPACTRDTITEHYTIYKPVYKSLAAVKADMHSQAPQNVREAGKIFMQGNFAYLVDVNRGVHVINISDGKNPVKVAFIPIPGCADIAIKNNYLYADSYKDMVAIDISNPASASLVNTISGVFPENYNGNYTNDASKIIVDWIKSDTTIARKFNDPKLQNYYSSGIYYSISSFSSSSSPAMAIGGSTARFGLLNNRMYTVSSFNLKVFNTDNAAAPSYVKTINMQQGSIETIFPYNSMLFIGSQNGMYVYNTTNPDNPIKLSQFVHARSCDPVIADGGYAYVTLSGGSACGGYSNELNVLDISNINTPLLVKTYLLKGPRGLSKDGNLLLICDGTDGLKLFDATVASNIPLIKQVAGFDARDVIAVNGKAIVTSANGLFIIDYRDPANAQVTGSIPVAGQ
ncbi:hypothetical protein KXQ82_16850 [Mucilaginibacter sp. HMF5004]|uniref:LVIVD repeat-containing protein n=1 Tax=Mucilaginibacter rivuli TaxID=2857527 RepID=UPI001C5F12F9|nr:hypothetical protein [Mucilaginibacter rivuli]MBW4891399.1 hypothetical protein [Mucilaginibacter rivuli]